MTVDTPKRREVAHDESPSIISDHAFVPKDEWWSLCKICNLAQASHSETTIDVTPHLADRCIEYYSDDNPEVFDD